MADKQLKDKAVNFKGSQYVMVKDRIQYLADNYWWRYDIKTNWEYFHSEKMWLVKAELVIRDEKKEHCSIFNGLAQEVEGQGFVNKTSALENAETSAIGRACAMAGIGVIDGIASIDEINKANNRAKSTPSKPEFWQAEFENLNLKKELMTYDEAVKKAQDFYSISNDWLDKIADLYWIKAWDLF